METEWYHRSHDSQLTRLTTTLLRELIRQLAAEQGVSKLLSMSSSRSTWFWCWRSILLMVRCLVFRCCSFGGSLLPTGAAVLPSFLGFVSIQTCQISKLLVTQKTLEIRLFVSGFSMVMEHPDMSVFLSFGLEFVTVAHGTFFKFVCYCGWLAFITIFLTISFFFQLLKKCVKVAIPKCSEDWCW